MTTTRDIKQDLPDGWRWVKLGEICQQDRKIVNPYTYEATSLSYLSLEHIESESGRILRKPIGPLQDEGRSTTYKYDEHHVLYGKLRPYLNKVALPNGIGRCTTELIPLLPCDGTDREYLAWILRRKQTVTFAMQDKTGSRMPRADMSRLFQLIIPLPPLVEQQRIAAILKEQMAAVEKARAAALARLEAVKALPAAFLRQVFPQPGQPLPAGWRWVKLGEVTILINGDRGDNYPSAHTRVQYGVPFVNAGHLENGDVNCINMDYISEEHYDRLGSGKFIKTDILYCLRGSIGKCALVQSIDFGAIASSLIIIRASPLIYPNFLYQCLISQIGISQIAKHNTGSSQPNLSASNVAQYYLPLPPLAEQQRIAAILKEQMAAVEKTRAAAEAELETINALPAALLRRAFNGEL